MRFTFPCTEEVLHTDIDVLELVPRAYNALKRNGITTIGDVVENWNSLEDIKSLGKSSIKSVRSGMFNYALYLADSKGKLKNFWENVYV